MRQSGGAGLRGCKPFARSIVELPQLLQQERQNFISS